MLLDIKQFFKISFPTLTLIFLSFFNLFISNIFFDFGQLFVFQAIFFWLLFAPKLLPLSTILIIGLLQDTIYLSPLGSTSLVFFFLIFLFEKYNKFFLEPSFLELLLSFLILFSIGMLSFWALISIINSQVLILQINFIYEIIINLLFFPINYFILDFFLKKLDLDKKYKKNV